MKKILALLVALLIIIGYYNMPRVISSSIPSVYYVTPNKTTYKNVVNCTGTIQSANVREIYLQSAIVPSGVLVETGDRITEGDPLLLVDIEMTEKLNSPASALLRDISGETGQKPGGIDWISLASNYGLTAVLSGGNIDYTKLQSALENGGSASNGYAAASGAIAKGNDTITAPVSGTVIETNVRADTPAASGMTAFVIADMDNFKTLAAVSESDIAKINVGDTAIVRGVGFGGQNYHGHVTKIYPTARKSMTNSDTVVDVEIELEDSDQKLKPGFSAKVEIMGGNHYDLITVPYEAIRQDENNDEYVYMYEDGKLKKQIVVTGKELTSEVEILGGLDFESVVVYNPSGLIKEGSMINIKGRASVKQ